MGGDKRRRFASMPYALKGKCVIRSDTGEMVKCHPTRTQALRHLRALYAHVPEAKMSFRTAYKVWSDKARAAALAKRRGQTTEQPQQSGSYEEAVAHANQLLAADALNKGKAGGKGRGKAAGKGGKAGGKGRAKAAAKPTAEDRAKQHEADRAQRLKEHQEDRARRQAEHEQDRATRQKEHAQDVAQRQQERATAQAERQKAARARAKAKAQKAKARAKAKAAKPPPEPSTKDTAMELETIADDLAIKAGARHSASDRDHVQSIHDSAAALGALCGPDGEAEMKAIADDPIMYAQHECSDVSAAAQALTALAYLAQSELSESEEDEGTVTGLAKAMRLLLDFLDNEIGEIEDAYAEDTQEDQVVQIASKAIGKREDVNPKEGTSTYGDVAFADAKNKKYPIDTEDHIRAAWNYINKADNAAKYDPDEVKQIKAKIVSAWKKKIDPDGPPSAATKGIETYTLPDGDELAILAGSSVKAIDGGSGYTTGYLVRFGGDGDLSQWRDIFTRETDYGRATKSDVWVHHRQLPGLGKRRLANQAEIGMDDEGVFIKHLLDLRNSYEAKLYSLAQAGKLGWSSGTAPHLVERKALDDGKHQIDQWPLGLDASYTPMPAGGLEVGARALKSLFADAGIDLLQAIYDNPEAQEERGERSDETKAADDRARRLLLELDLLQLEATIT